MRFGAARSGPSSPSLHAEHSIHQAQTADSATELQERCRQQTGGQHGLQNGRCLGPACSWPGHAKAWMQLAFAIMVTLLQPAQPGRSPPDLELLVAGLELAVQWPTCTGQLLPAGSATRASG